MRYKLEKSQVKVDLSLEEIFSSQLTAERTKVISSNSVQESKRDFDGIFTGAPHHEYSRRYINIWAEL